MAKFNTGDTVELKSGGPKMTVSYYEKPVSFGALTKALQGRNPPKEEVEEESKIAVCRWFGKDMKQESGKFHEDMLISA